MKDFLNLDSLKMTKEQKIEALSNKIREALPYLKNIEVGQIFNSSYYGNIVSTRVNKLKINLINVEIFDIYGFDVNEGLPRSLVYPKECTLVGREPKLNDVLAWLSKIVNRYYCQFKDGYFYIFYSNGNYIEYKWNLEKPYLKDQSAELIDFLYSLVEQK